MGLERCVSLGLRQIHALVEGEKVSLLDLAAFTNLGPG